MTAPALTDERLVEVAPGAWDALLDEFGVADAYLLRGYAEAACALDQGRAVLLHLGAERGDVVFAAIVREVPGAPGWHDVTTPYGYGGPVAVGAEPPVPAFHAAYEAWCRERRVVTTFVRFHPLFDNHELAWPQMRLERLADTATWPLAPGSDPLAEAHSMHRRGARKAERAGVEVTVAQGAADVGEFVSLYEDAMRRRGAEAFYLFPSSYWDALVANLGDRLVRFEARVDGTLVASLLLLATSPWLHYHLGATTEAGFAVGASKLLFVEAARWGAERGFSELHLGSGVGGRRDSLWMFKQRFSPHPGRPFWIGKLVHDAATYRRLSGSTRVDGFFPAYRAPAAPAS